uniref:Uncharacterized protein n=1 Tax=Anguilla anguilla TaxID=7936 RepID=A0A0E9RUA5_ANGAN
MYLISFFLFIGGTSIVAFLIHSIHFKLELRRGTALQAGIIIGSCFFY